MKRLFFAALAVVALAISAPTTASADHYGYGGSYGYSSYSPSYVYSSYRSRGLGYSRFGYGNYRRGIYVKTARRGYVRHRHHHHLRHRRR